MRLFNFKFEIDENSLIVLTIVSMFSGMSVEENNCRSSAKAVGPSDKVTLFESAALYEWWGLGLFGE